MPEDYYDFEGDESPVTLQLAKIKDFERLDLRVITAIYPDELPVIVQDQGNLEVTVHSLPIEERFRGRAQLEQIWLENPHLFFALDTYILYTIEGNHGFHSDYCHPWSAQGITVPASARNIQARRNPEKVRIIGLLVCTGHGAYEQDTSRTINWLAGKLATLKHPPHRDDYGDDSWIRHLLPD